MFNGMFLAVEISVCKLSLKTLVSLVTTRIDTVVKYRPISHFYPSVGFVCLEGKSWQIETLRGFKIGLFEPLGEVN